ncbi:Asp/Glu/hydantoin racemase [Roseobacter denitrificans]|uniref:Hydantoin racemase n=1 Tax=Roseobacter denitrificans (strain ATCC 33942 / OCh 114) TaxID=375451 RepID=Q16BW2_ROSDO|nr:aspartate/glutamate racemase family protein [Roseobacter denitrificans]ABG30531.1 hydantoin racemase [Roseobacter denitrificans OCh 114]AVL53681.1 Asp/Glu/hydantoin racemase [Roseobacter denitrificans]SFF73852.1 allantoin racemase [Roseobacter denitrificans OCh 114]
MKILMINPNTTSSMTDKIAIAARSVARPDTDIIATNSQDGPASIQGFLDVANCIPGLLAEVALHKDVDAIVVACFDDTGVDAVRTLVDVPVLGIGEAAYHAASMIANKFSVITTLSRSVPGLENNLMRYGLAQKCARVRATDIPVLKLEEGDPATLFKIKSEIREAIAADNAEAIVLGCAGMADLMAQLSDEFGLPVIDGVAAGVTFAEALVNNKLRTSKIGAYSGQ